MGGCRVKIKIKSFNGELPYYLSVDDEYEIEHIDKEGRYFIFNCEFDDYICISNLNECIHLNGGSWVIVE